jgi:aryl-alcohol dehydrogenase-like predicted oxidoreductase
LRYRSLGSSGIDVSVLGFGAWGIGGRTPGATSYGATDDAVSRRALHEAFEHGITFFDTASAYGDGHSERLIGECFKDRRNAVVIATKAGVTRLFEGMDVSASALRVSLEGSLRRLGTDYVDLFQLHNASAELVAEHPDLGEVLDRFQAEGKIRAYGFSTPAPADAAALLDYPKTTSFQVNCNVLDWRAVDSGLFEGAVTRRISIIARTPLAFGFLTGAITTDTVFSPDDHRSRWSRAKIRAWLESADALFAALTEAGYTGSRAALALRFCLSFEPVATVIPGMLTPEEVRANVAACAEGPLDPLLMQCTERVYRQHVSRLEKATARSQHDAAPG